MNGQLENTVAKIQCYHFQVSPFCYLIPENTWMYHTGDSMLLVTKIFAG